MLAMQLDEENLSRVAKKKKKKLTLRRCHNKFKKDPTIKDVDAFCKYLQNQGTVKKAAEDLPILVEKPAGPTDFDKARKLIDHAIRNNKDITFYYVNAKGETKYKIIEPLPINDYLNRLDPESDRKRDTSHNVSNSQKYFIGKDKTPRSKKKGKNPHNFRVFLVEFVSIDSAGRNPFKGTTLEDLNKQEIEQKKLEIEQEKQKQEEDRKQQIEKLKEQTKKRKEFLEQQKLEQEEKAQKQEKIEEQRKEQETLIEQKKIEQQQEEITKKEELQKQEEELKQKREEQLQKQKDEKKRLETITKLRIKQHDLSSIIFRTQDKIQSALDEGNEIKATSLNKDLIRFKEQMINVYSQLEEFFSADVLHDEKDYKNAVKVYNVELVKPEIREEDNTTEQDKLEEKINELEKQDNILQKQEQILEKRQDPENPDPKEEKQLEKIEDKRSTLKKLLDKTKNMFRSLVDKFKKKK